MAISVVSFSFSRAAQPEAQRPSSLLDDGFLYCILSPTGLQNSIGGPEGPFGRVWLFVPHLVSNSSDLQLSDFLSSPSYIIVQSPTQLPPQSLEWHVWLSSSGNNCHAVQRSLSSSASVYECIMGFYLVPFCQPNPPMQFLSITGHWNVSLPSGASLWNGMFGRVEGQNTTLWPPFFCAYQSNPWECFQHMNFLKNSNLTVFNKMLDLLYKAKLCSYFGFFV